MKTYFVSISCAALLASVSAMGIARAQQQAAPYYARKTITLVVGSAAGGIFDLGGRLMARFLPDFIPGHPNVVVQNMPGASSVVATEYIDNVAPRDGLTVASVQPTIALDKSLDPILKYQPGGLTWIGRIQPTVFVGVGWRASGVNSIEDARKKTVIVSAQGASGISAIVPWALNKLAGTHFRVITGYNSEGPAFIAMERGEVQGIGSAALTDVLQKKDWAAHHSVALLYSITQKRSAMSPGAPALPELAQSDMGRKVLTLLGQGMDVGQNLVAPPGIPADREAILRTAFDAMVKDPNFIAQAKKLSIYVDPMDGSDLTSLVTSVSAAPDAVVHRLREVARPQ